MSDTWQGWTEQLSSARGAQPEGTRGPGLCPQCGQRELPTGGCFHGNTPVTHCVTITEEERTTLAGLALTEQVELLRERRTLAAIREQRRDGSWSDRIAAIDRREAVLKAIITKVQP